MHLLFGRYREGLSAIITVFGCLLVPRLVLSLVYIKPLSLSCFYDFHPALDRKEGNFANSKLLFNSGSIQDQLLLLEAMSFVKTAPVGVAAPLLAPLGMLL